MSGRINRIKIYKDAHLVATSKNLRGLLDYARRPGVYVKTVSIHRNGNLYVVYSDRAACLATFADYSVLCGWLRSRRSWHGAEVWNDDVDTASPAPGGILSSTYPPHPEGV